MHIKKQSPKIDEAKLEKALSELPDYKKSIYTEVQDKMILKYVPLKGSVAVAKILGFTHKQVYDRYRLLRKRSKF